MGIALKWTRGTRDACWWICGVRVAEGRIGVGQQVYVLSSRILLFVMFVFGHCLRDDFDGAVARSQAKPHPSQSESLEMALPFPSLRFPLFFCTDLFPPPFTRSFFPHHNDPFHQYGKYHSLQCTVDGCRPPPPPTPTPRAAQQEAMPRRGL